MYKYFDKINGDGDLKKLSDEETGEYAGEIREFLIDKVTKSGGHLASNLGVVELTLALHRVFDFEKDRLIFDVGHQSYTHKILTGRKDCFDDLRKPGGLSGFTLRSESKYDPFGAGHSSTSVSAALGFAEADKLEGRDSYTVAVIGDGAFTGGMVHEALNNCHRGLKLIIVLNENEMSISPNRGKFARLISRLRSSKGYVKTKRGAITFLERIPFVGNFIYRVVRKVKNSFKRIIVRSNYFEEMGLAYIGPCDGNDIETTELMLEEAKRLSKVAVVHVKTKKGKGYEPAENDPMTYHSFYPDTTAENTFNAELGSYLEEFAERDKTVCAVTAAMGHGTGLNSFEKKYPERFFDVGIAEEHALTFCAGLACGGMKPYFAVYSTFLQRGYDNILHDIALQNLAVRICIDRAGLAASDGATHHGIFDVSFMSAIPNISIFAPATLGSMRAVLKDTENISGPVAIRYSNCAEDISVVSAFYPDGDYENYGVRSNDDLSGENYGVTIVTYGRIVSEALRTWAKLNDEGIKCQVILLEQLKPMEETAEKICGFLPKNGKIIFVEEGMRNGGAGMMLRDAADRKRIFPEERYEYEILAIDDFFPQPQDKTDYLSYCGIDAEHIYESAKCCKKPVKKP